MRHGLTSFGTKVGNLVRQCDGGIWLTRGEVFARTASLLLPRSTCGSASIIWIEILSFSNLNFKAVFHQPVHSHVHWDHKHHHQEREMSLFSPLWPVEKNLGGTEFLVHDSRTQLTSGVYGRFYSFSIGMPGKYLRMLNLCSLPGQPYNSVFLGVNTANNRVRTDKTTWENGPKTSSLRHATRENATILILCSQRNKFAKSSCLLSASCQEFNRSKIGRISDKVWQGPWFSKPGSAQALAFRCCDCAKNVCRMISQATNQRRF